MLFIIIPLEQRSVGSVATPSPTAFVLSLCLPSFFSLLLRRFFGTDFNSPSDQFGIHKPLCALSWKPYLQGMMKHVRG